MCGRFTITKSKIEINQYLYDYFKIDNFNIDIYTESYNVSPGQKVLAIINDGVRNKAGYVTWGFLSNNNPSPIINARSETIDYKKTFSESFINKRCIILADGFYEWEIINNQKIPHRIILNNNSIFPMAGIWTKIEKGNNKIFTCAILTTKANKLIKNIHERMPVILNPDELNTWLNPNEKNSKVLKSILNPYSEHLMNYYPVSKEVNSSKNNSFDLINRI